MAYKDRLKSYLEAIYNHPKLTISVIVAIILIIKLSIVSYPSPEADPEECLYYKDAGKCGFVFDEAHYVPAVRKLLKGIHANDEHPPLSKFLMMAGIIIFGDNPLGWRFFIVLLGSISIGIVGLITLELTNRKMSAYVASILFATDVMSFNLSSIAMLDAPGLTFGLISIYFAIKRRYALAGFFIGLSLLCKLNYVFILCTILFLYILIAIRSRASIWRRIITLARNSFLTIILALTIFIIGISIYNYIYNAFDSAIEHIKFMLDYHSKLKYKDPSEVDLPFSWINPVQPFKPASYYVVSITKDSTTVHPISYLGIFSPIWFSIWVIVPLYIFCTVKDLVRSEFKIFEITILGWIFITYIPYFLMAYILNRYVFPFYFYSTIPALSIGVAKLIEENDWKMLIPIVFITSQVMWFFIYFPVKTDLHISILKFLNLPA